MVGLLEDGARQTVKRSIGRTARALLRAGDVDGLHRIPLGPAAGLRLDLRLPDVPVDMYLGLFEWEVWRHMRTMLRPGMTSVDVGGHLGWYSLIFARHTQAHVWSFEPDPDAAAVLRRNCEQNPECGRHVTVLGGKCSAAGDDPEHEIALDSFASASSAAGLIKVDVDGPEAKVLAGGERTLREVHPHVVVETHSRDLERECAELLVSCNYRPLVVTTRQLWHLQQNRPGDHNRWLVAYGRPG